jgi:hypothetical protein
MLFIAPEAGNINEDSKEYLQLHCSIELKKLRRMLAEEEFKKKQVACEKPATIASTEPEYKGSRDSYNVVK